MDLQALKPKPHALNPVGGLQGSYRDNEKEHGNYHLGFRVFGLGPPTACKWGGGGGVGFSSRADAS